ncbi:S8 family serine peptidase [Mesomycoplasma ovipneumoniae]|uniref:S8 family serine peptidase n=1 Tax=Mesomycoplasma ovipneumoniae TaxID=29562 RepID=UPI001E3B0F2E|nr:S8 family serine peptidase [Mesomycoplasma ovipneumoniae]
MNKKIYKQLIKWILYLSAIVIIIVFYWSDKPINNKKNYINNPIFSKNIDIYSQPAQSFASLQQKKHKKIFSRNSKKKFESYSYKGNKNNYKLNEQKLDTKTINIKLILDFSDSTSNLMIDDINHYTANNNKYFDQITKLFLQNNIKINSKYISKLSPIIWINIDVNDEHLALKLLEELDFIALIINNLPKTTSGKAVPFELFKNTNQKSSKKWFHTILDGRLNGNYNNWSPPNDDVFKNWYIPRNEPLPPEIFHEQKEIVEYDKGIGRTRARIGVVETDMSGIFDDNDGKKVGFAFNEIHYFNIGGAPQVKEKDDQNDHAILVSKIAGGTGGFSPGADLFIVNLADIDFDSPTWMTVFERLIIEYKIKIINHSYGYDFISKSDIGADFKNTYNIDSLIENSVAKYMDHIFYLDFLSRKYGVINVFAAGNEYALRLTQDKGFKRHGYISGYANALNSIVVGSTFGTKDNFFASDFSNRLLPDEQNELPKPLISAPGENITGMPGQKSPASGTSFSTPIVTGIISEIYSAYYWMLKDKNIIPAIMSLLASSANDSSFDLDKIKLYVESTKQSNEKEGVFSTIDDYFSNPEKKSYLEKYNNERKTKPSGLDSAIGAGQISFKNIKKAISNLKTFSVSYDNDSENVYYSPDIEIEKGKKLKASLAWAFNAGLTKPVWEPFAEYSSKNESKNDSWFGKFSGLLGSPFFYDIDTVDQLLKEKYEKEFHPKYPNEWLNRKTLFEKQKDTLFSDYNLILQRKDGGTWEDIKLNSGNSKKSNVELIRYTAEKTGIYRLVVKKNRSSLFKNSIDDDLAVSHVIQ